MLFSFLFLLPSKPNGAWFIVGHHFVSCELNVFFITLLEMGFLQRKLFVYDCQTKKKQSQRFTQVLLNFNSK